MWHDGWSDCSAVRMVWGSSPSRDRIFFSSPNWLLRSTQPFVEGVPEFFPGIKVARRQVDYSQTTSFEVRVQLYLFSSCMLVGYSDLLLSVWVGVKSQGEYIFCPSPDCFWCPLSLLYIRYGVSSQRVMQPGPRYHGQYRFCSTGWMLLFSSPSGVKRFSCTPK